MTKIQINGSETGTVRLFQLDLPPEAVERFTTQAGTGEYPLQYALGARNLRPDFVDVVAIRDLADMPLSRYLTEAHSIPSSEVRPMKAQLDSLTGVVLILPSQAFGNVTQDLTVATPLRWVATFSEEKARTRGPKLQAASATGTATGQSAATPDPQRNRMLTIILTGLGVLILLILALAFRS